MNLSAITNLGYKIWKSICHQIEMRQFSKKVILVILYKHIIEGAVSNKGLKKNEILNRIRENKRHKFTEKDFHCAFKECEYLGYIKKQELLLDANYILTVKGMSLAADKKTVEKIWL